MHLNRRLRSTTVWSGIVGGALVSAAPVLVPGLAPVLAADISKAPQIDVPAPAVDGFNGKLEGLGGSFADRSIWAGTYPFRSALDSDCSWMVRPAVLTVVHLAASAGICSGAIRRKRCSACTPTTRIGTSSAAPGSARLRVKGKSISDASPFRELSVSVSATVPQAGRRHHRHSHTQRHGHDDNDANRILRRQDALFRPD